ncbi:unnamed protein product [Amoebophrya sp. A120]|nr:unnamed protein product [Amoebophrya sp. A120]|eukprot:GSA120T00024672001.1
MVATWSAYFDRVAPKAAGLAAGYPTVLAAVLGFAVAGLILRQKASIFRKIEKVILFPVNFTVRVVVELILFVNSCFENCTLRTTVAVGNKHWKKVTVADPHYPVQIEFRHCSTPVLLPCTEEKDVEKDKKSPSAIGGVTREEAQGPPATEGSCSSAALSIEHLWSSSVAPCTQKLQQQSTLLYVEREPAFTGSRQGTQSLHVLQKIVQGSSLWDLACDVLYRTIAGGTGYQATKAAAFFKFLKNYRTMAPQLDYLFDHSTDLYGIGLTHKAPALCYRSDFLTRTEKKVEEGALELVAGKRRGLPDYGEEVEAVETPLEFYQLLKPHLKQVIAPTDVQSLFRIIRLHAVDVSNSSMNKKVKNRILGLFDIMAFLPHSDKDPNCFLSVHNGQLELYSYDKNVPDWRKITVNRLSLENSMLCVKKRNFVKSEMGDLETVSLCGGKGAGEAGSQADNNSRKQQALEQSTQLLNNLRDLEQSLQGSGQGSSAGSSTASGSSPEESTATDEENKMAIAASSSSTSGTAGSTQNTIATTVDLTEEEQNRFLFAYRDNQMWDSFEALEEQWRADVFPLVLKRFPKGTEQLGALYEYVAELMQSSPDSVKLAKQYAKLAFVERFRFFGPNHVFTKRAAARQKEVLKMKSLKKLVNIEDEAVPSTSSDQKEVPQELLEKMNKKTKTTPPVARQTGPKKNFSLKSVGGKKVKTASGEEIELEYGIEEYNEIAEEMIRLHETETSNSSANTTAPASSTSDAEENPVPDSKTSSKAGSTSRAGGAKNAVISSNTSSKKTTISTRNNYKLSLQDKEKIRHTKEHLVGKLQNLSDLVATLNNEKKKLSALTETMSQSLQSQSKFNSKMIGGGVPPQNINPMSKLEISPAGESSVSTQASPPPGNLDVGSGGGHLGKIKPQPRPAALVELD